MAEKKCGYIGKIDRCGSMVVKAPVDSARPKGKTVKHTGSDLRSGKGK